MTKESEQNALTDAELASSLEALPSETAKQLEAPAAISTVLAKAVAPLADKAAEVTALAAKTLTEVLPLELYRGASSLQLSEEESRLLQKYAVAGDEDLDVRPDGLVYATHMFYRRALTELFGAGQWADRPVSPIQVERNGDAIHVFQRWALYVRGCYISESIGAGTYYASNDKMDKADAAEIARSQALTRNASKSSLGIATNPWVKREANEWRRRVCKQVIINTSSGRKVWWRRNDGEPFSDRDGRIIEVGDLNPNATPAKQPVPVQEIGQETAAPARRGRPAKAETPKPDVEVVSSALPAEPIPDAPVEAVPDAPKADLITEPQMRLFIAEARRRGLIKDKDATAAVQFLVDQLAFSDAGKLSGKTSMEGCVYLLRRITMSDFSNRILPVLRSK